jgi:hypothetical protein
MKKQILIIGIVGLLLQIQLLSAQTWTADKRLTWASGFSFTPDIAVDSSNNIHVVWDDSASGNSEILYKKSTNGGLTWSTKKLTWNSVGNSAPAIAIDSADHIHVVWGGMKPGNFEIFHKKSTDGGTSWATKRLTWSSGFSWHPAIAVDSSDNVHLVWFDDSSGNDEIYYKKSTNGGASWITKRLLWNSDSSWYPAMTIDPNDNIHVVWEDSTPGNWEILYKKSTNGGVSWTSRRLTWNSNYSSKAAIAADSVNHIYVVWVDGTPMNPEIFYKKSTDGGSSWTTKRLTWSSGSSRYPDIAIDSNNWIHVVWDDRTPGNPEIYYKRSTNGGAGWTTQRLTWKSGESFYAAIALDFSDNIHVVWNDENPGNFEIYYKKGIQ